MPSPLFSIWLTLLSPFFTDSLPLFFHDWENETFCVKCGLNADHFISLVRMRTKSAIADFYGSSANCVKCNGASLTSLPIFVGLWWTLLDDIISCPHAEVTVGPFFLQKISIRLLSRLFFTLWTVWGPGPDGGAACRTICDSERTICESKFSKFSWLETDFFAMDTWLTYNYILWM